MSGPDLRRAAAARALELVEPGMRLGLGTGSTAAATGASAPAFLAVDSGWETLQLSR